MIIYVEMPEINNLDKASKRIMGKSINELTNEELKQIIDILNQENIVLEKTINEMKEREHARDCARYAVSDVISNENDKLKAENKELKEKLKSYNHIGEGTLARYKEEIISQRIARNPERKLSDLLNLNKNIGKPEKSEREEMFVSALREIQKAVRRSNARVRVNEIVTEVLNRLGVKK